ncbi:ankyrin repeat domain-containing protein 31 [Phodopus roborovskii]|uniref:ankyrin repeat domain-containing protein 31 n=1 Tax=Phodopus roborovskii TaxID=109678 RepID=UPI0021E479F1|nr:ankyrin repeat domain-containing protein 31 [Phodopus roborovskii]
METGAQVSDCDSDETVIEGSVTENELDDEELPWRRLLLNQDTSLKSEFCFHSGVDGMWKGMPSPVIHLGLKLRKDSEEQKNKNEVIPTLSEDLILQDSQDEAIQNQVLLQTRKEFPASSVSPHPEVSWSHRKTGGPEVETCENLPHPGKELSQNTDSPEISLLLGTSLMASDLATLKEKSLTEPVKTLAVPNTFSDPGKEVSLIITSKETKDEESSLETFVSALERLLESPEGTQEETNDFNLQELMNPLSNSLSSVSVPLSALPTHYRDVLENMKDSDVLPAELLATINTLPGADERPGPVGPNCQGQEKSSSVSDGNGCLEIQPTMSQIDEDCTQIAQTIEDPKPYRLQIMTHEDGTSYEQLNNKGNSEPVENTSVQETPHVLRRSSRLKKLKASRDVTHTDVMLKMPEKILSKPLSYEDRIHSTFATKNFSKRKNMHLSRFKSEQIQKNEQLTIKNGKRKMNKMFLCNINRRNIFGENLVYKAALHNDVDLVRCCIKNGGNVNQPSYAGWTALHEASVGGYYQTISELLKGGADVNVKGKYQITPLHDAVMNGHYEVAELLLLNGADPLFRSDHGTCALDEAKDSFMENLLRKYIPKHTKCHLSAERKSTVPAYVEDIFQYKKPKLSSNNHTEFICDGNCNRQEPGHIETNKGSNNLLVNKEYVYEHCQKNSSATEFDKNNVHSVKDSRTDVSKSKGPIDIQHKETQVGDRHSSSSQGIAVSSFRRMNTLVTLQQHTAQTLVDLPKESCELSIPISASLKNSSGNSNEACLVSRKLNTHILDLSDSQEMEFLELGSVDQTKASSFSELPLYKEIKLPHVTADQQPHTNQDQCSRSRNPLENNSLDEKGRNLNEWEDSFLSFIKGRFADSDSDCQTSVKSVASQKESMGHCHNEESTADGEEMGSVQVLSPENYFSQENELTTYPQEEEAVNYCDSNKTLIYEQHIPNYKQYIYGTSFDHSYASTGHNAMPCRRPPSTQEVTQVTGQVEVLKAFQNNAHREPTPLVNQADTYNMEKMQDTERNDTVKDQKASSSNSPLHTLVHSQVIEISTAEKRTQDLPGNEPVNNADFHSTDNVNKELANSSQRTQGEKEMAQKSDEELTGNASRAGRAVRDCKEKGEKVDLETHMTRDTQEHRKDQSFRKRKGSLESPCSQGLYNTAGIKKRNVEGESQLHMASREGNLSLVKVLVESGADVNLKDNAGWTPLHEASSEGFSDIITVLLEAGAHVNCESMDGTLPLHAAAVGNHLKAAEILLGHGANPNQKDQKQRTALEEADDGKMKELLKSYCAVETSSGNEISSAMTVKRPVIRPKRYKSRSCNNEKTIDPPSPLHRVERRESLPAHQTISAILQDIEEKQENLLKFEIRNSEDAEHYIRRMLEIKEVMDNILAQQKTERDDLAKKYRVSMESFKHGALREQLANLATRQKSLLVVAKKQKMIRLKIQNYKNAKPFSGISLRKHSSSSDISSEKKNQESPSLEHSVQPHSGSLSSVSLASVCPVNRSVEPKALSVEIQKDSQNSNICLDAEVMKRGSSGNEVISKANVQGHVLDVLLKSRHSVGTEKIKLPPQPVAFIPQGGNSQAESAFTETVVQGHRLDSSPSMTGTVNISEDTSIFSQNDACLPTIPQNQDLSRYPTRSKKKTASHPPSGGASEPLAHLVTAVLDTDTMQQTKPCPKTASVVVHANDLQTSPSSGCAHQHPIKKPSHHSTAAKKKNVQLKDLISLGRINPGNDILEFKTQETTHKASILLSGKLKVENGQIYQNPVAWLKDLLGGGNYVTWNYAWSKVTYLGKELLKYVYEVPVPPEPQSTPQQQQPCLPGIPHYLQIKEILLISDQELLPCHVMEQHWKFYVNCKRLPF